jgi:hypothetical protein
MFERRGAMDNVPARACGSPIKSSALGPSAGTAGEIRSIRGEFKLTFALLLGVWLFIAGFVLLALLLNWRL